MSTRDAQKHVLIHKKITEIHAPPKISTTAYNSPFLRKTPKLNQTPTNRQTSSRNINTAPMKFRKPLKDHSDRVILVMAFYVREKFRK